MIDDGSVFDGGDFEFFLVAHGCAGCLMG
jgi:hypothetical protein